MAAWTKVCAAIPFYDRGLETYGEQWFWQIRPGDTLKTVSSLSRRGKRAAVVHLTALLDVTYFKGIANRDGLELGPSTFKATKSPKWNGGGATSGRDANSNESLKKPLYIPYPWLTPILSATYYFLIEDRLHSGSTYLDRSNQ